MNIENFSSNMKPTTRIPIYYIFCFCTNKCMLQCRPVLWGPEDHGLTVAIRGYLGQWSKFFLWLPPLPLVDKFFLKKLIKIFYFSTPSPAHQKCFVEILTLNTALLQCI